MNNYKKHIKFKTDIYPLKFQVFINMTKSEIISKIKLSSKVETKEAHNKINELELLRCGGYMVHHLGNFFIIVYGYSKVIDILDTLAHEISHACFECGEWLGFEHNKGSEEFYTYLNGYITRKVLKEILN